MVTTFDKATEELRKMDDLVLFAVLKMDEITDRWTLMFGVKENTEPNLFFKSAIKIVRNNIEPDTEQDIARVGVFSESEHLITELIAFKEGDNIEDQKVNGNFIHAGKILISTSSHKVTR